MHHSGSLGRADVTRFGQEENVLPGKVLDSVVWTTIDLIVALLSRWYHFSYLSQSCDSGVKKFRGWRDIS